MRLDVTWIYKQVMRAVFPLGAGAAAHHPDLEPQKRTRNNFAHSIVPLQIQIAASPTRMVKSLHSAQETE